MVLTVSFALSSVTGLCCHRRARGVKGPSRHFIAFYTLDASVGASGPHDFAVRGLARSSARHLRPSHPAPRPWRSRNAPLWWGGTAGIDKAVSTWPRSKIFFEMGLDSFAAK